MKNKEITINDEQLVEGLKLKTGEKCTITLPTLVVKLKIDPEDDASEDDTYMLYSTDKDYYFNKTLTVNDDKVQGDKFIELHYYPVRKDIQYSLCIDPGKEGEKYNVFENRSL